MRVERLNMSFLSKSLIFVLFAVGFLLPHSVRAEECSFARAADDLQAAANCVFKHAKSTLVIVGELHGTTQIPALTTDLIREAASKRPVRVGLEMPEAAQAEVQRYVGSQGDASDLARLKSIDFWKFPDGRATASVLNLIETVRSLHDQGYDVGIFAMEPTYPDPAKATLTYKEKGMAQSVSQVIRGSSKSTLVIALMGSYHARYPGQFNGPGSSGSSVAEQLATFSPTVLLVDGSSVSAWTCVDGKCGIHRFKNNASSVNGHPEMLGETSVGAITVLRLLLPELSASSPIGPTYH